MNSKQIILGAIGGLIVLASANTYATTIQTNDVVAREASEGPRGADRIHGGTHKNSIDTDSMILAREATSQRQRQSGKPGNSVEDAGQTVLAREASEGPRGEGKGHRNGIDASEMIIAREAAEGPRGADNERPGDRQRRGGRVSIENPGDLVIAREASEGPRGADNNNHRQRRGGRSA